MSFPSAENDEAMVAFAASLPVYFAFSESIALVKIGFSVNVQQRLHTIPSDRRDAGRMVLVGEWLEHPGRCRRRSRHARHAGGRRASTG